MALPLVENLVCLHRLLCIDYKYIEGFFVPWREFVASRACFITNPSKEKLHANSLALCCLGAFPLIGIKDLDKILAFLDHPAKMGFVRIGNYVPVLIVLILFGRIVYCHAGI